ncbi:streptococcin A-M57 [Enterococcus sp. CSURQ0835]|uniref:streptococcin A-M57 n=1 Tax=Enterococcus sp. CSURQ0835 TaxID=2681394 RepID=UPI001F3B3A80|nr:streptococcin A-M57 [Enterococcus sp. CSURQ0835]
MFKKSKVFCFIATALLGITPLITSASGAFAAEVASQEITNKNIQTDNEISDEELVSELRFYFEEAGYLDSNNQYVITDLQALQARRNIGGDRALAADFFFNTLVSPQLQRNGFGEYAKCVILNSIPFGSIVYDCLTGQSKLQAFVNALASKNFDYAVDMLKGIAATVLTPAQLAKFNWVVIVVSVGATAVSCAAGR